MKNNLICMIFNSFITNEECMEPAYSCAYYMDVRVREYDLVIKQSYQ